MAASASATEGPTIIRIATPAPDGTAWAREMNGYAREVEAQTQGRVRIKWYANGIAGDEITVLDRIRRGQIDGVTGPLVCDRLSSSMRVLRMPGLYHNREEWSYVLSRLRPVFEAEFAQAGFVDLGEAFIGTTVIFSRTPVQNMADFRRVRMWHWDVDDARNIMRPAMKLNGEPLPLEGAMRAYETGRVDGFLGIVPAALAFQWSARAKYMTPLEFEYLPVCTVVAKRAMDVLTFELQTAVRAISAKYTMRLDTVARDQEDSIFHHGLFQKQGLTVLPVSEHFLNEFRAAAADAREQVGDKMVPRKLLNRAIELAREYRAKHPQQGHSGGASDKVQ